MPDAPETRIIAVLAFVDLTAAVVAGELLAGRAVAPRWRGRLFRFHRAASVLGLGLAGLHVTTLVAGTHVVTAAEALVPGAAAWTRPYILPGQIGLAAMLVAALTWRRRSALGSEHWRSMHRIAYAAFVGVLLHAWVSHEDGMPGPEKLLYLVSAAAVVAARFGRTGRVVTSD